MLSFIIPAYNEEALIGQTVAAIHSSVEATGEEYEIIVVDDASIDRTAQIAHAHNARVVSVNKRQIAAVRNAGAKEARGDVFVFVDADTIVPECVLLSMMDALRSGAIGGGSNVAMDDGMGWFDHAFFQFFLLCWRPFRLAAGCFVFARRSAFEAVGGFDELYFASEEVWISKALKQQGRFVIVPDPVITSARKLRMHGTVGMLLKSIPILIGGTKAVQKREGLELWYDGRRESTRSA